MNTEVATITVEGREGARTQTELELLADPYGDDLEKRAIIKQLESIALAQNNSVMETSPTLVRLYRVTDMEGILRLPYQNGKSARLDMALELICEFDHENQPKQVGMQTA